MGEKMEIKYLGDIYYGNNKATWGKGAVVGDTAYLSGLDGADPRTGAFPNDIQAKTRLALQKGKERLDEAGSDIQHIVRFVTYIVGRQNIDGYRRARDDWFKANGVTGNNKFASTLLLVSGLAREEMFVEIDITAVMK